MELNPYHGAMSKHSRSGIQEEWMLGEVHVLCCTSAFGMGVDKKNVRAVVHLSIPSSIEEYY